MLKQISNFLFLMFTGGLGQLTDGRIGYDDVKTGKGKGNLCYRTVIILE